MKALISHPFSGALYAFFAVHNENRFRDPEPKDPHPYYRTLYGDAFPRYQEMALTLLLLFDEIVMVPADAYLPKGYWRPDKTYHNPHLGCTPSGTLNSSGSWMRKLSETSKTKTSAACYAGFLRSRVSRSSETHGTRFT